MLKLDAHDFSPALLEKILLMAGRADSCEAAAEALRSVGEISITARTVNQLASQLGGELAEKRDQRTLTYLINNCSRMDYPRYRCEGLPVTSSLAESLVKQISKRVKGTEKFWDDGPRGKAILQIRAACISQDARLSRFVRTRPISPHSPRCRPRRPTAAP